MTHEELKVIAQDLGITEELSYNDLQKAVSQARKAKNNNSNTSETMPEPKENPDMTNSNPDSEIVTPKLGSQSEDTGSASSVPDPSLVTPKVPNEPKTNYTDEVGRIYTFTDRAPSSFRFNGLIKTKEEWLQDEEAMEQLAIGNCSYVEQILN